MTKDDKFEEIAEKWNGKNCDHDTDDDKEEGAAQMVEWTRNPIDEEKVDCKGNKQRGGGELVVGEALIMCGDREGEHTERDGKAYRERILDNVFGEAIFDAISIVLQGEDKGWETDTGEV